MQVDSLNISSDTVVTQIQQVDTTLPELEAVPVTVDTTPVKVIVERPVRKSVVQAPVKEIKIAEITDTAEFDEKPEFQEPIKLFSSINNTDSAVVKLSPKEVDIFKAQSSTPEILPTFRYSNNTIEKGWLFGVTIFILALLVIVRLNFQRYLTTIITSAVNMQLSEKLLREKNVIVRRVFFILNVTYVLVLGLFLYRLATIYGINLSIQNSFILYLFICLSLSIVVILRIATARIIAIIFDSVPVFREYLHNAFIINKNLGLYLFPAVVSIFYLEQHLSRYLLIVVSIVFAMSILFRYIKAAQIIMRHNIFLFYSILYLCTLEILPVMIGIKFVLTQR
jgi:hypothetical protein